MHYSLVHHGRLSYTKREIESSESCTMQLYTLRSSVWTNYVLINDHVLWSTVCTPNHTTHNFRAVVFVATCWSRSCTVCMGYSSANTARQRTFQQCNCFHQTLSPSLSRRVWHARVDMHNSIIMVKGKRTVSLATWA